LELELFWNPPPAADPPLGNRLHRHLAVLGGVADILRGRALNQREALFEALDDVARFIQAERGLGQIADARGVGQFEAVDILHGLHQVAACGTFAQRADHLVVILVADEHDAETVAREPHRFQVNLGDQRAGGVDDVQAPLLGLRRTVGATPCALKMARAPAGTSSSSSTKMAPASRSSSTTCLLWTISLRT
jgi:hypothetical protein